MRTLMMAATVMTMGALALGFAPAALAQVGGGGGGGEGGGDGQMSVEEIARKIEEIARKMDQVEADLLKLAAEAKTERAAEIAAEIEELLREGKSPEEIQQIIDKQLSVMNDITDLMNGSKNEQEELIKEMTELVKTIEKMQQPGQGPPQEGDQEKPPHGGTMSGLGRVDREGEPPPFTSPKQPAYHGARSNPQQKMRRPYERRDPVVRPA
jgi:hypothetical protein